MSAHTVRALFEASVESTTAGDIGPLRHAVTTLVGQPPQDGDVIIESLREDGLTETLRALAQELDTSKQSDHAWPLIQAASMLAPDSNPVRRTHLLVAMSTLRDTVARDDARRLLASNDDHSDTMGLYLDEVFADATFNPVGLSQAPAPVTESDVISVKDSDALVGIVGVFSERLRQARALLIAAGADVEAGWLVPYIVADAPPVALGPGQWLDPELTPLELVHVARIDWSALTSLLAVTGCTDIGSTTNLTTPTVERVEHALAWAEFRLWRIRDQQLTGGDGATRQALPTALWRGHDVARLPPSLLGLAERECARLQAVASWLSGSDLAVFEGSNSWG